VVRWRNFPRTRTKIASRPKPGPILIDPLSKKKTLRPAGLDLMAQLNLVVPSTSSSSLLYLSGRSYSWGSPQLATSNQGYRPWHKLHMSFPCTMLKRQLSEVQAYSKLSDVTLRPTSRVQSGCVTCPGFR
jgi:hypothetical protein